MGGNALKNAVTRRYAADEYHKMVAYMLGALDAMFPHCRLDAIKAYRSKESFGDMDIVLESDHLPTDWQEQIIDCFKLRRNDWFKNGNCFSFAYRQLQIDLIVTPSTEYETSLNYFAYNDLGNLCGRIAHMMGMKLGHDGLAYNWRVGETYHFKTLVIETDWAKILPVIGLSYDQFDKGFDTMEEIFEYVAASRFFSRDIYLLHNRNHTSRVRDQKRKTYMEFLNWLEAKDEAWHVAHHFPKKADKREWLPYLFQALPGFEAKYNEVQKEWEDEERYRRKFNGDLVKQWTGLEGKELGYFMKWLREQCGERLKPDILSMNDVLVERYVMYFKEKYDRQAAPQEDKQ